MSARKLLLLALVSGCALATENAGRTCAPVTSWASPAYECVVAGEAPPPPPPKAEATPEPEKPEPKAEVSADRIDLKEKVEFENNSAKLSGNSDALLDDVAKIMEDHPEILKIEIQGHTDSNGKKAHNQKLSTDRAASVKAYLVGKGIAEKRMVSKGFGQDKPIADNKTDEGRAQNRRVEIHILKRK